MITSTQSNNFIRFKKFLRISIEKPSIPLGVLLTLISIIATIFFSNYPLDLKWAIILILASFILSLLIGYFIIYNQLTSTQFANTSIQGRPVEEKFIFIATQIKSICREFNKSMEAILPLLNKLKESMGDESNQVDFQKCGSSVVDAWHKHNGSKISIKTIRVLNRLLVKQEKRLKRIEAMKNLAAAELGISPRRLCNHVFQFSTSLYRDRFIKVIRNFEELNCIFSQNSVFDIKGVKEKDQVKRVKGLITQILNIKIIGEQRLNRQVQVLKFRNLHKNIFEIASKHSSSSAISAYARIIALMAIDAHKFLLNSWKGNPKDRKFLEVEAQFEFIFRKQQVYPGYDLHESLMRLMEYINTAKFAQDSFDRLKTINKVLFALNNIYKSQSFLLEEDDFNENVDKKQIMENVLYRLKSLSNLYLLVSNYITSYREELVILYRDIVFPEFFKHTKGNKFIVTHGYSKTVRQIIKHGLTGSQDSKNYIYILSEDDYDFESRLLKLELQKETSKENQCFRNVAIGNVDSLLNLFQPKSDSMMVLLGAESFDKSNRIVHPTKLKNPLEKIVTYKNGFLNNNILISVAAEGYKKQLHSLVHSKFYDDNLDKIHIYGPDQIDLVVSDHYYKTDVERKDLKKKIMDFVNPEFT